MSKHRFCNIYRI